ncbi:MAG: hypothetical protein IIC88_04055 [Chloroflexi bacterium]|nr:hypothetical protein [Chloroflexota bacterium]
MILLRGRLVTALAVLVAMGGLLVFSISSPAIVTGQETDSDVGAGAEGPADPPASLPQTGTGGYIEPVGSDSQLQIVLLAAVGVTLAGAGVFAMRYTRREPRV